MVFISSFCIIFVILTFVQSTEHSCFYTVYSIHYILSAETKLPLSIMVGYSTNHRNVSHDVGRCSIWFMPFEQWIHETLAIYFTCGWL